LEADTHDSVVALGCGHMYHKNCVGKLRNHFLSKFLGKISFVVEDGRLSVSEDFVMMADDVVDGLNLKAIVCAKCQQPVCGVHMLQVKKEYIVLADQVKQTTKTLRKQTRALDRIEYDEIDINDSGQDVPGAPKKKKRKQQGGLIFPVPFVVEID
jgi:hypothetical protein